MSRLLLAFALACFVDATIPRSIDVFGLGFDGRSGRQDGLDKATMRLDASAWTSRWRISMRTWNFPKLYTASRRARE